MRKGDAHAQVTENGIVAGEAGENSRRRWRIRPERTLSPGEGAAMTLDGGRATTLSVFGLAQSRFVAHTLDRHRLSTLAPRLLQLSSED